MMHNLEERHLRAKKSADRGTRRHFDVLAGEGRARAHPFVEVADAAENRAMEKHVGALHHAGRHQDVRRNQPDRIDRQSGDARVVPVVVGDDGSSAIADRLDIRRADGGRKFEKFLEVGRLYVAVVVGEQQPFALGGGDAGIARAAEAWRRTVDARHFQTGRSGKRADHAFGLIDRAVVDQDDFQFAERQRRGGDCLQTEPQLLRPILGADDQRHEHG